MLFQRINKTSPEKVFATVFNADSVALVNGDVCTWKTALTEATGAGFHILQSPATALLTAVAGVAIAAFPAGTTGLIQIYGFHAAVKSTGAMTAGASAYAVTAATAGTCKAGTLGTDDSALFGATIVAASGNVVGLALRCM